MINLKRTMALLALALVTGLAAGLTGCASFTERSTGLEQGELTACPAWPRCVSSAADAERKVEPLQIIGDVQTAWQAARSTMAAMHKTTIVAEQPQYLRAEVSSPWNFYIDDFELLLKPALRRMEVRSSGRIGYFDFHVNRDRVEALRAELAALGVVRPAENSALNNKVSGDKTSGD